MEVFFSIKKYKPGVDLQNETHLMHLHRLKTEMDFKEMHVKEEESIETCKE